MKLNAIQSLAKHLLHLPRRPRIDVRNDDLVDAIAKKLQNSTVSKRSLIKLTQIFNRMSYDSESIRCNFTPDSARNRSVHSMRGQLAAAYTVHSQHAQDGSKAAIRLNAKLGEFSDHIDRAERYWTGQFWTNFDPSRKVDHQNGLAALAENALGYTPPAPVVEEPFPTQIAEALSHFQSPDTVSDTRAPEPPVIDSHREARMGMKP